MTPEMKKKRDELAIAERIYEPKYGGKDHSGYDTMMKYEVNDEREDAFSNGFNAAHDLMQEKIKPLIKAAMWFAHNPPAHFDDCQSLYEDDDEKCNCGAESRHDDLVAALKGWE